MDQICGIFVKGLLISLFKYEDYLIPATIYRKFCARAHYFPPAIQGEHAPLSIVELVLHDTIHMNIIAITPGCVSFIREERVFRV